MSVNRVILLGHVGRDPELRYPEKDMPVAFFSLATNERRGTSQTEITEWHRIVMYGQNASLAERYIRKGTHLYLEGRLQTREFTDRTGITRQVTEIIAERFELLGRAGQ